MFDQPTSSPDRDFHGRTFAALHGEAGAAYESLAFSRCRFEGCSLGSRDTIDRRSIVRNVSLVDCRVRGCATGPAIFEDVTVSGLVTANLFQLWGPAFRHVVLRGKIGRVMISNIHSTLASRPEQRAFQQANRDFYADVDWALDIAEAQFEEADLRGVPGELVRRDPDSQVVVRRDRLLDGRWRTLDLRGTWWATSLQGMLDDGIESEVLVAPTRDPDFDRLRRGLLILRDEGIAEQS